jgi:DNA-binding MarR family transcriptional regulator
MEYKKVYNDILDSVNDFTESGIISYIIDRFIFEYKQFNEAIQISQQYLSDIFHVERHKLSRMLKHLKELGYIDFQRDYKRNLTTTIFILGDNSKPFYDEILKDRIITNNNKKKKANEK